MGAKCTQITERFNVAKTRVRYSVTHAILDFTEQLIRRMRTIGMSKTELAKKLNTSPAYITKLLRGENNFTLETMVKVAHELDSTVLIEVRPKNGASEWFPPESVIILDSEQTGEVSFESHEPSDDYRGGNLLATTQFKRHSHSKYEVVATTGR